MSTLTSVPLLWIRPIDDSVLIIFHFDYFKCLNDILTSYISLKFIFSVLYEGDP